MVAVDFAYGVGSPSLHRSHKRVQLVLVGVVPGDRLVHYVVCKHDRLVGVARGDPAPDAAVLALKRLAPEKPGISVAVVVVRAGLPAGARVHVENHLQSMLSAPADDVVEAAEPLFRIV